MNQTELTPTKCNDAKRWLCGEISLGKLIELSGLKSCHAQSSDFAGAIHNAMDEQLQCAVEHHQKLAAELKTAKDVLARVLQYLRQPDDTEAEYIERLIVNALKGNEK